MKQNSVGGTYRMPGRSGKLVRMFGHVLQGGHLGNPCIGGRIILNWILYRVGTEEGEILCRSEHGNECISDKLLENILTSLANIGFCRRTLLIGDSFVFI